MRRFRFDLQRVLDIRELRKLLAEENLGRCLREEKQAQSRLDQAYTLQRDVWDRQRAEAEGRLEPWTLKALLRYRTFVEEEIGCLEGELQGKKELTGQARSRAIACAREVESLSKLKDRRKKEYRDFYWWQQGKVLDEIAALWFNQGKRR